MKTSIIILTHNQLDYTKSCLESIRTYTTDIKYELIVVDNASTDGTVEWLMEQKDIKCIYNKHNEGFPKGCNQGIELSTGSDILLLNNDTIVTENWLKHLLIALYSGDDVGAVGPVTNYASYSSSISTTYVSIEEMQEFAKDYNVSNPIQWEERMKLIGFCMLIKKRVIDEVGLLNEIFTPGNFEDDDLSLRILQKGYKLYLCKDTFIHHHGSVSWNENASFFTTLLHVNSLKFYQNWNFSADYLDIQHNLWMYLPYITGENIKLLQLGCRCGATLLKIKQDFPKFELYGLEHNEKAASFASKYCTMLGKSYYNVNKVEYEKIYDIILVPNTINEAEKKIWIQYTNKLLKEDGKILFT